MSKLVITVATEKAGLIDRERAAAHVAAVFVEDGHVVTGVRAHATDPSPASSPSGKDGFYPRKS